MGLGIRTKFYYWWEMIFRYRCPALRWRYWGDSSQHGEFKVLRQLVEDGCPKLIVDVGANDGQRHSNSYPFIARGWSGILFEPNPRVFADLQMRYRDNPKVTTLNYGCARQPGTFPLFLGRDGDIGEFATLSTEDNEYFRQNRTRESVEVKVDSLTRLLRQVNCPPEIGILTVDTEGFDFEVLASLDFQEFRPRLIITEDENTDDEKKFALLRSSGYAFVKRFARNSIWMRAPVSTAT